MSCKKIHLFVIVFLVLFLIAPLFPDRGHALDKGLERAGDILQIGLPAAAAGATLLHWDWEGFKQFALSYGSNTVLIFGMKEITEKRRPSSDSRNSYPSGHTASSFGGAAFLNSRYGPLWGVPAYALAAMTGYSRINADAHFTDDVLAGASVAMFCNWYFVNPVSKKVAFSPMLASDGMGLMLHANLDEGKKEVTPHVEKPQPQPTVRFEFDYAPSFLIRNKIRSPRDGGTTFDLGKFHKRDDPTTTTIVSLEWTPVEKQHIELQFAPFESRDTGMFSSPVTFNNVVFAANTPIKTKFLFYDARARYGYDVLSAGPVTVRLGVEATVFYRKVEIASGMEMTTRVDDVAFLPLLNGRI
jgi:membrane-associated phospholipid phosphatase